MQTQSFDGDYGILASCSYDRLYPKMGAGLQKADLPTKNSVRLTRDTGAVVYWDAIFTREGTARTRVDVSTGRTIWGPALIYVREVMPTVQACSAEHSKKRGL